MVFDTCFMSEIGSSPGVSATEEADSETLQRYSLKQTRQKYLMGLDT